MAGWKSSLASVLKEHNSIKASDGTVASHETQHKRSTLLYQAFTDLREMGYKLDSVSQLKGRHVEALTRHWLSRELSSSTLQNCSGQLIPDTTLSFSSARAGANPSLN